MGGSKDLHPLLRELESIRGDDDVKGLLLKVGPLGGGFIGPVSANIHEIRQAVLKVKEAGKPVVAYMSEGGSSAELYLASAADRIVTPRSRHGRRARRLVRDQPHETPLREARHRFRPLHRGGLQIVVPHDLHRHDDRPAGRGDPLPRRGELSASSSTASRRGAAYRSSI